MRKLVRNRIVDHVQVRAGDLIAHPYNFRRHPPQQRDALAASYSEVGFARSLLGFRRPDGRIQLIDGHLRRDLDPEMEVTVELLDVNDDEARKLLLTIDPLAGLADADQEMLAELTRITEADSEVLDAFWKSLVDAPLERNDAPGEMGESPAQFLVLITCRDEAHQVELLARFESEGLECRALLG
jgi:hypothetical protein